MPKSLESSNIELGNENQIELIERGLNAGKKYRHQNYSKNIYIGTKNAEKWELTRTKLSFKNDVEFVSYLLTLAENDFVNNDGRNGINFSTNHEQNVNDKLGNDGSTDNVDKPRITKKSKKVHFADPVNSLSNSSKGNPDFVALRKSKQANFSVLCQNSQDAQDSISSTLDNYNEPHNLPEVLDCRIAEKIKSEMEQKLVCESEMLKTRSDEVLCLITTSKNKNRPLESVNDSLTPKKKTTKRIVKCIRSPSGDGEEYQVHRNGKSEDEDDDEDFEDKSDLLDSERDEYDFESDDNNILNEGDDEDDENSSDNENETQTFNFCRYCLEIHVPEECPFRTCQSLISDKIDLVSWSDKFSADKAIKFENVQPENGDIAPKSSRNEASFSESTLPDTFELKLSNAHVSGVIAKSTIPKFTKMGPLIAPKVNEVDITDDCTMKFIIEAYDGKKSTYYSLEDENNSNWLRYIRPADSKSDRNVAVVISDKNVFFVTSSIIEDGQELMYWSDDCNSSWGKKKIEKMNCGGCNLKFDHPLFYRNHCSIFHDPSFSLTIRKYHCKICGASVLGKDNIMKHAAQMHDGKGAYQCQYCKKFFLRLNYLEMHRTYGCSANPQRARPLCDFCGRKFCQPQKLKVHIKRMHSDMADVLRDFQCKLCSKLLGSRAALQRHSKEVHSRNSAVVSCPRCQKLFQNRSNLKIHMLTHSGVRPFKCIEGECNAAFTTKQCLQFHYKKVHNYAQEQMPKIERSVAYTFDAYSGGMKVEYLEQASRKRRKSSEDQNSVLSSAKSETEFSEDNIFENFKKSGKTISNLCKTESNLSLLSSRISSILEHGIKQRKKERKPKVHKILPEDTLRSNSVINGADEPGVIENKVQEEFMQTFQKRQPNKQLSLIESFLSTTSTSRTQGEILPANHNQESDYKPNEHDTQIRDLSVSSITNPIASKGSRKWMSSENSNRENDSDMHGKLSQPNRDFLTRLMMNESQHENDDENSTFLDVVDNGQAISQYSNSIHTTSNNLPQLPHLSSLSHLHVQSFGGPYYNNTPNCTNRNASSSASMLVEAALSSVGNILNVENDLSKNSRNDNHLDNNDNMNNSMDIDMASLRSEHNNSTPQENRFIQNMSSIENEIKMMKNLTNFSLQLPHFDQTSSTINNQTPGNTSPIDNNLPQDNDIDVDTASTPHTIEPTDKIYQENDNFVSQHQTSPTPHVLSPGRDYSMYNSSNNVLSPIPQLSRRNYPEHELISPATSPALPRYSYRQDICRKREMDEHVHNMSGIEGRNSQQHLSSDDENSIMAQNLTMANHNGSDEMRLKFSSTQMELMYSSKYENGTGSDDISDLRSKYMDQNVESGFRSNGISDGLNDMQGLDMTSRTNLTSGFHHNFQLTSTNSNLNIGRYHHHIYDILSEREQQQEQLQHQQHMQHMLQDQMSSEQDQDQATSVDLSLMTSRVVSSQTPLSYSHTEMLRMASIDLAQNTSTGMISNRTFLSPHNSREGIDHHRFLSSADQRLLPNGVTSDQISVNHRLLVDPTAHLLMEQNSRHLDSRLLSTEQPRIMADSTTNRHMVSPRGFGAYQVSTTNYHHSVRPITSPGHHSVNPPNYHPFPSFY